MIVQKGKEQRNHQWVWIVVGVVVLFGIVVAIPKLRVMVMALLFPSWSGSLLRGGSSTGGSSLSYRSHHL
jgi:hypothetical protein